MKIKKEQIIHVEGSSRGVQDSLYFDKHIYKQSRILEYMSKNVFFISDYR
jgi:hypothetical protein